MTILIKNINMIDVRHGEIKYKLDVLIEGDRIKKIGSNLESTSAIIVDGNGKYLIPGLIDSHMHFFQSSGIFTRPDVIDLRKVKSYSKEFEDINLNLETLFRRYLSCGITGVVDCGGPFWNFEVKKKGRASKWAPEISVAGPLISTVSREVLDLGDPPIIKAESKEKAIELARKCSKYNPVFVKSWFIYLPDSFDIDSEIIKAGIEETKRLGLRAAVHATELETAKRAILFGADILVHSVMNEEVDEEFIALLKQNKVIYIPTLIVSQRYVESFAAKPSMNTFEERNGDPAYFASLQSLKTLPSLVREEAFGPIQSRMSQDPTGMNKIAEINLRKLSDGGVVIATGTDAGNIGTLHGPSMQKEMEEMSKAGMSPFDILRASTLNAAKVLNRDDVGEIREGNIADLVLLDGDPTETITNTTKISMIMKSGKIFPKNEQISSVEPVDVVQKQFEMYNNRDVDGFLSTYDAGIKIYDLQTGELRMQGLEEMRERYSQLFIESPNLSAKLQNRIIQGSLVIDHELVSGFRGNKIVQTVAIYEVKYQYITRVWFG